MRFFLLSLLLLSALSAESQTPAAVSPSAPIALSAVSAKSVWQMQDSGSMASLRGIDSVDGLIAWASGTEGTVLRTVDGGAHWSRCATPDGDKDGATLDFRGVQAWDAETAIVMASGPGEKSRLYKTGDGCKTWTLMLKNLDPEGFYDFFTFWDKEHGFLLGDPVMKTPYYDENWISQDQKTVKKPMFVERTLKVRRFLTLSTIDGGNHWAYWGVDRGNFTEDAALDGVAFAASNSSAFIPFQNPPYCWPAPANATSRSWIGIGGKGGPRVLLGFSSHTDVCMPTKPTRWIKKIPPDELRFAWSHTFPVPIAGGTDASGVFALAFRPEFKIEEPLPAPLSQRGFAGYSHGLAVGGDYTKPDTAIGTAAWTDDGGEHWTASAQPPHGYRSAVQWSEALKLWFTVGTNGSDISRDDGKNWQPLDDGDWNALSLPFVVGPKGRIARLDATALPAARK
jgi:photosystem II stability/assembly factor-like uncharacterized protein